MLKILRLKFLRNKYRKRKIHFVQRQNFDAAAQESDKEKKLIANIQLLREKQRRKINRLKSAFGFDIFRLKPAIFSGFVVLRKTDDIPVRIDGYMFAVWMNIYIEAALAESETLKKTWNATEENTKCRYALFERAAEYFFIETITDWLSSQSGLHELNRSHIPDLLKTNPFFDLFSSDMQERKVFHNIVYDENVKSYFAHDDENNIAGFFSTFKFKYPLKCKIERVGKAVKLTTPYYSIRFRIRCSGNAQTLPQDYSRLYLGFKRNSGRRIDAEIVATKCLRGLLPWNRKHIKEVLVLKEILTEYFSAQHYFDKLDWENKRVMAVVMGNVASMKVSMKVSL